MILKFIHTAFIRKSTTEISRKLDELGYYPHPNWKLIYQKNQDYNKGSLYTGRGFYASNPIGYYEEVENSIDCGTNEDLFLAIAALREDTDVNQWFVMDVEVYNDIPMNTLFKATSIEGGKHIGTQINPMYCHKATVSELIEYFKKKGETK